MNDQRENALQAATDCLKEFLKGELTTWIGPYNVAVSDHLKISIGPLVYNVPEAELVYGETTSLPSASLRQLSEWAFRHPEVFSLFKIIAADLVQRPQELPEEVRLFTWAILRDKVTAPKAPAQSASKVPSTKIFLRDFATCQALVLLQSQFNLAPTHNMAHKDDTGASIVSEALGGLGYSIGVSSVNAIWSKRQEIQETKMLALQEIRRLPSSLTH